MKPNSKRCLFLVIFGIFLLGYTFRWNHNKGTKLSTLLFHAANTSSWNKEPGTGLLHQGAKLYTFLFPAANTSNWNKEPETALLYQHPTLRAVCKSLPVQETLQEFPKIAPVFKPRVLMMDFLKHYVQLMDRSLENPQPHETELQICMIMSDINQLMPNVTFAHLDNTTCVRNSKASIVNPRDHYFIGDIVIVRFDMYDFLGTRKTYGGDYLRARIYSPDLQAGAAGKITDFLNGTYHVQFTLFWAGNVKISLLLIHSSEAVSALWRGRHTGYDYIKHRAKYISPTQTVETACGYQLNTSEEVCDYMSKKDEYPFYCIKPAGMSCNSLTQVGSFFTDNTYLSTMEKTFFKSSDFPITIPHGLKDLVVEKRTNGNSPAMERCKFGMKLQYPGGYFVHNIWQPVSCSIRRLTDEEVTRCLQGKNVLLIGDSTMMQWLGHLSNKVKTLKELELYDWGWQKSRLKIDPDRNIRIKFQKHGDPFVPAAFYQVLENPTIAEQIDRIGGNKNTVIVFTVGTHFKGFPLHLFIRRAMNIRRALQRLLLRSPETKVVVKTENISYRKQVSEIISDFHGYTQYLIMNAMLRDLNIGIVDAWEIATAFDIDNVHAPPHVIANEIDHFLTFIC